MITLSTVCAASMMTSRYSSSIAAVAFRCAIAVVVPSAFLFAHNVQMWAGACWWKSAVLTASAMSWSILFGSGTPSSCLKIRLLFAKRHPDFQEGP